MIDLMGLSQLFIAVICFGTTLVPVKKYSAGDGFFAQWIMSIAIMLFGFIVFAFQDFEYFNPHAMLGGVFWSLGNMMAIPIIKRLGLALGLFIWNATSCIFSWIPGTFGGFGIEARPASIMWLSVLGLVLIFIGLITYEVYKESEGHYKRINIPTKELTNFIENVEEQSSLDTNDESDTEAKSKSTKLIGLALALACGFFWGINLLPIIRIQDNHKEFPHAPKEGLPYVFSHFCGAFITSSIGFLVYAIINVKRNKMEINPQITIPALAAGSLWAIAETLLINATAQLSVSITYPISVMLPGCIAALWSVLYFKEIEHGKNLILLITAIFVTLCGAICIGVSK
uniref:Transmembrane protein 144 n=1 Tax=Panagrolaimus davidi TaxID=227884 RepID=A0A914P712_9BILA